MIKLIEIVNAKLYTNSTFGTNTSVKYYL